jgi:hypothetical protein
VVLPYLRRRRPGVELTRLAELTGVPVTPV